MAPGITTLAADAPELSAANTGFMLICSALVMLMTPGLAFFYGGMVRVKSTLNMLMMSFISLGIVTHPVGALRIQPRLRHRHRLGSSAGAPTTSASAGSASPNSGTAPPSRCTSSPPSS